MIIHEHKLQKRSEGDKKFEKFKKSPLKNTKKLTGYETRDCEKTPIG
jgi:hypothetical protein